MSTFQSALADLAQFLVDRQQLDAQAKAQSDLASASASSTPAPSYGGMQQPDMGQLLQLAQQGGIGGGGGGGGGAGGHGLESEHGVTGNTRAMGMLDRVANQYPGLWSHVISSYRTRQEQERLYQAYKNGTGNLAAPPGHSMHEKGLAFDISAAWLNAHPGAEQMLNRLGGFPVSGEPWHWQPQWTI